jgi:hypothetical protein
MACQRCNSERIVEVCGKTSDACSVYFNETEHEGTVPFHLNIGGGDYIEFNYCLDCGQIQGEFPLPLTEIEKND